jgi:signal recognition particle subunit SRP54
MGDLKSLMGMIPGMAKMTKNLDIDDTAFNKTEAIILSMTPDERANPEVLNISRKRRIAKGSGHKMHEVNQFIKQFHQMKKMMNMMSKGKNMNNLLSRMKGPM